MAYKNNLILFLYAINILYINQKRLKYHHDYSPFRYLYILCHKKIDL